MTTYNFPDIWSILGPDSAVPYQNATIDIPSTSVLSVGVDASAQLELWQTPVSCTAVLKDTTGTTIDAVSEVQGAGSSITMTVTGSALTVGHGYTLTVTWEDGTTGSTQTARIKVHCPF